MERGSPMANPTNPPLLPDPACLHLTHLEVTDRCIIVHVSTTSQEACCPLCHRGSEKIHSRYTRRIADLPWMGWAVQLDLHTRRFFGTAMGHGGEIHHPLRPPFKLVFPSVGSPDRPSHPEARPHLAQPLHDMTRHLACVALKRKPVGRDKRAPRAPSIVGEFCRRPWLASVAV